MLGLMRHLYIATLAVVVLGCSSRGADEPPRTLAIDATATLHLPPDCAAITLTFAAEDADLGAAHDRVETSRGAFVERAERFDARVETGTVDYRPYRPQGATVDRYRASQTVVVRTGELDEIPRIIREAGDGLSAVSVRYYVEDMTAHRSRLRQMAIEAAGAKADELADGFDVDLGDVLSVAEGGATTHAFGVGNLDNAYARVETTEDHGAPPPGAIPLRVTLRVTYELEV